MRKSLVVKIEIIDPSENCYLVFSGRDAWTLLQLLEADEDGLASIKNPGTRWSDDISNLCQAGLDIETIDDYQDGPFAGKHARYVLRSNIRVCSVAGDCEVA